MKAERIHPNARTTPRVRAEIQGSPEPVSALARRYAVSQTTIRRWRGRSTQSDGSHRRHDLGQSTTPEVEAILAELRRTARLSLDDLVEVVRRCLDPALSRSAIWRALKRLGLNGPLEAVAPEPRPGRFEAPAPGFVHLDLKYLRKLHGRGEFVLVAIERATRFVHVEVLPDRRADTVVRAVERFLAAAPFAVHTILTDNGSEFTDRFAQGSRAGAAARPTGRHPLDRLCKAAGLAHKLTRPHRPQTNGMAERFNRRLAGALRALPPARDNIRQRTKFSSHAERQAFILGFVANYNRTRLRCLGYLAPNEAVANLTNQTEDNT